MTNITKETLAVIGFNETQDKYVKEINPEFVEYVHENLRFILHNYGYRNLSNNSYTLHIDNSDMNTIANCEVEYIEQIQTLIELYKNY